MADQSQHAFPSTAGDKPAEPKPARVRARKGRKSRGASVAPSPLSGLIDFSAPEGGSGGSGGVSGVRWATPPVASSRQGTPAVGSKHDEGRGVADGVVGPHFRGAAAADDDDDEVLPDMADDDYSRQQSYQSQSTANLKVLMDNFSPDQYDRYEAYRRNALPKEKIRKIIAQALNQQVSTPVAQVIAGFSKVFVGEIVEKARKAQQRRGESGPLSPDHLREAYREYQEEAGRVGATRPLRNKKLFVR